MKSTDKAWQKWGERDPYFGVLSGPENRRDRLDKDRFFDTGERQVDDRLSFLKDRLGFEKRGRALDFGCGVGRLVKPLARRFDEVVGVDISPAMLAEARANLAEAGNVRLVTSDDALSRVDGLFDLINTYIVLQHMPTTRGMKVIARFIALTAPGGALDIHFPIDRHASTPNNIAYWLRKRVPGLDAAASIVRGRRPEPMMQMNIYPLATILHMLDRAGFGPVVLQSEMHRDIHTVRLAAVRERAG